MKNESGTFTSRAALHHGQRLACEVETDAAGHDEVVVNAKKNLVSKTQRQGVFSGKQFDSDPWGSQNSDLIRPSLVVPQTGLVSAGLNVACTVRFMSYTLDERLILRKMGVLATKDRNAVEATTRALLLA